MTLFEIANPDKLIDCSVPFNCDVDDSLALYGLASQGFIGDVWKPRPTSILDVIPKMQWDAWAVYKGMPIPVA